MRYSTYRNIEGRREVEGGEEARGEVSKSQSNGSKVRVVVA
jgi:hypothetical protein